MRCDVWCARGRVRARLRVGRSATGAGGERTESVTFSYFGEHDVTCKIGVSSFRTVEGTGAAARTHLTAQTAIASGSDTTHPK